MSYYLKRSSLSGVTYGRGGLIPGQWGSMGSLGEDEGGSFWSDIVGQAEAAWDTVASSAQTAYDQATSATGAQTPEAPVQCPPIANGFTMVVAGKCELANCNVGFGPNADRTACIKSNEGEYCDLKGGKKGIVVGGKCVEATPLPPGFENIPEGVPCQLKAGAPGGGIGKGGKCVSVATPAGGGARGSSGGARPPTGGPAAPMPAAQSPSTATKILKNPLTWVGAAVVVGGLGLVVYKKRKR